MGLEALGHILFSIKLCNNRRYLNMVSTVGLETWITLSANLNAIECWFIECIKGLVGLDQPNHNCPA